MQDDWRNKLKGHTGQWAFVLTLSRRMCEQLAFLREIDGKEWPAGGNDSFPHWVTSNRCLTERGLIEHLPRPEGVPTMKWNPYRITPAGRAVLDLLVYAGVIAKPRARVAA